MQLLVPPPSMEPKISSIKKKDNFEYFDDCLICHVMEKADKKGVDLSVTELKEVFEKQNKKSQYNDQTDQDQN